MKLELPAQMSTPQAVSTAISELVQIQDSLRSTHLAKRTGATGRPTPQLQLSVPLQQMFKDAATPGKVTLDELGMAIEFLKQVQQEAPVITVTLATEVSADDQHKLAGWFQKLTPQTVLCRFNADSSIAGGVVVRTPRRMYDLSYATLLQSQSAALAKELARG